MVSFVTAVSEDFSFEFYGFGLIHLLFFFSQTHIKSSQPQRTHTNQILAHKSSFLSINAYLIGIWNSSLSSLDLLVLKLYNFQQLFKQIIILCIQRENRIYLFIMYKL